MRDLKFGSVLRGIPTSVATTDPRSAGEFDIQGTPGGTVRLELLLPSALERPGVASMPIGFAPGDGSYDASPGAVTRTFFDPHLPVVTQLGPRGKLIVWLGGTVTPDLFQVKGIYVATVSLTVFNLGT
jgi:hypothetical protein